MPQQVNFIVKGMLFTASEGEYDDYNTIGLYRALSDINVKGFEEEVAIKFRESIKVSDCPFEKVLDWLVDCKHAEKVSFVELHLEEGNYCVWRKDND